MPIATTLALALAGAPLAPGIAPAAPGAPPDRVELASGATFAGRVLYADEEIVLLREQDRTRRFRRADVASLTTREDRVGEILDRLDSLRREEIEQRVALAARAQELGLAGEATVLRLGIVLEEPDHAATREALGHERIGGAWRAPWKGEWLPLSAVARQRMRWDDAWVFETAHYRLRASVDLPTALQCAIDLEIAYRAFYEVFGRPLGLHHVQEPLAAEVHGDPDALPYLEEHLGGFFDVETNVLIVDATRSLRRGLLFHEATHQLLHNARTEAQSGAGPRFPAWVDEGLAEFMQAGLDTPERPFDFDWAEVSTQHVRAHLVAREPATLARVLALESDEFRNKDRAAGAYAAAYTLVDYCMHADSGRRQPAFLGYLRRGCTAPLSPEDFVTLVAGDVPTFEQEWRTYVEEYIDGPLRARLRRHPPR